MRVFRLTGADLEIRPDLGCLKRSDGTEIHLRPKTFQTLVYLVQRRNQLVTKDDIVRHVWLDVAVTDDAVIQCIVEIRKVLGDTAKVGRYIRTLPRSGYRFVADVRDLELDSSEGAAVAAIGQSDAAAGANPAHGRTPSRTEMNGLRMRVITVVAPVLLATIVVFGMRWSTGAAKRTDQESLTLVDSGQPHRQVVAVMVLENQSRTPEVAWLREGIADMLISGLARSKTVSVVSRQQLEALLRRTGHSQEDPVTLEEGIAVARSARADLFVLGTFAKLGHTMRIDLRLHEAGGRLVKADALTVEQEGDLLAEVDLLALRLIGPDGGAVPQAASAAGSVLTRNLDAYRYYSLGVGKADAYHTDEAIALFRKATELDPEFAMAYARIGYTYGVTGGHMDTARPYLAKAYRMADRLGDRDRGLVEAWNALVNLDYPAAITAYRRLIVSYPLEIESYYRLGNVLLGERRFDEALAVFRDGLAVDPGSADLYHHLGGAYTEMGRHAEAIAMRTKYVALEPKEPNAHDVLALSYQWAGRYDEAIAEYQRALDLKPDFDLALVHLGNTYVQTGRYRAAQEIYRRYIRVAPSGIEVARGYDSLAGIARRLGRPREAAALIESLSKPLSVPSVQLVLAKAELGEPVEAQAQQLLTFPSYGGRGVRVGDRSLDFIQGVLALRRGAEDVALRHFRNAVAERPHFWNIEPFEDCLANAYLEVGRLDDAVAEYQRVLRLNPNYPLAHYRLGLAYERLNRRELAKRAYEDFLRVWASADPDVPEIQQAKLKLQRMTT